MSKPSPLKRPLLYVLVASVVLSAMLGVALVVRDTWSWFEQKVIFTTMILAVASLCGLACDLSRTPRGKNLLPKTGLALTFLGAVLILIGMWFEIGEDWYWRISLPISIFAVATVHVCLLSIVRLAGRFRWVYMITCQVIFGLAALISIMIFFQWSDGELFQIVAALSIVDVALTFVVPLLHRISKTDPNREALLMPLDERNIVAIDQQIVTLNKQIADLEKLRAEITGSEEDEQTEE